MNRKLNQPFALRADGSIRWSPDSSSPWQTLISEAASALILAAFFVLLVLTALVEPFSLGAR